MGAPKSLLEAVANMFISIRRESRYYEADPIWKELDLAAEAALNFALIKEFGVKYQLTIDPKTVTVRVPGAIPELYVFGEL